MTHSLPASGTRAVFVALSSSGRERSCATSLRPNRAHVLLASRRLAREVASLAVPAGGIEVPLTITEIQTVRSLIDHAQADRDRDRDRSDQTLRDSERRFRRLFHDGPLPRALVRDDGGQSSG